MGDRAMWTCRIGEVDQTRLAADADGTMREAVGRAYHRMTGERPLFTFSGWGEPLPERYRAVVEDREPDPRVIRSELLEKLAIIERVVDDEGAVLTTLDAFAEHHDATVVIERSREGRWDVAISLAGTIVARTTSDSLNDVVERALVDAGAL